MKLIATLFLVFAQLVHLPIKPSLKTALENRLIAAKSQTHLVKPSVHEPVAEPIKVGAAELQLGARNVYALDLDSASILINKSGSEPRPIASIAKLATVMVILNSHSLDEVVTIPTLPAYSPDDVVLGLKAGQQFKLRDLLAAALIPSDNDAADALALHDSPTQAAFAAKMNRLASHWGITGARFTNPSGLGSDENMVSAEALAKLAKIALTNPTFAKFVATSTTTISDLVGKSYSLTSTNQLLGDPRISGLKTGFTSTAGQCLVALATIKGHRVITVVLNSPDRFGETTQLVNWIEANWNWQ